MITEGIRTALGEELANQVEEALKGKGKDGKDLDLVVGNDGSYVPVDKFNTATSGKSTAEAALKAAAEALKEIGGTGDPAKIADDVLAAQQKMTNLQETYDADKYETLHLMGHKRVWPYRFDAQERALCEFRKFATAQNVHVTLVIHPRKEPEDQALNISSVFGTAKATQEADNVLIIQNENGQKKLEVKKNRFDGDLGCVGLRFNKERLVFEERRKDEKAGATGAAWHGWRGLTRRARWRDGRTGGTAGWNRNLFY